MQYCKCEENPPWKIQRIEIVKELTQIWGSLIKIRRNFLKYVLNGRKKWLMKEKFRELHKKVDYVERHKCSVLYKN